MAKGSQVKDLPRLPFFNQRAVSDSSVQSLLDSLSAALPGDFEIEALGDKETFRHRTSLACIGDLSLFTTAVTPVVVRRQEVPYATLRIPISGYCSYKIADFGRRRCIESAGRTAVLLSGAPREAETGASYNGVQLALNERRLVDTAAVMLRDGDNIKPGALTLDADREISLTAGGISFDSVLRSKFALIDSLASQPHALAMLCLDDLIYRSVAIMLQPEPFLESSHDSNLDSACVNRTLDRVCGFVMAYLGDPISLTKLEQISGFSRRSLQYAFLKRFGCTPMQWVREQRLGLARSLLSDPASGMSITEVALSCGFPNAGMFAGYYHRRFGELPSATLAGALSR